MKRVILTLIVLFALCLTAQAQTYTPEEIDCFINLESCIENDTTRLQPKKYFHITFTEEQLADSLTVANRLNLVTDFIVERYKTSYPQYDTIIYLPNKIYKNLLIHNGVDQSYTYSWDDSRNRYKFGFAFQGYGVDFR